LALLASGLTGCGVREAPAVARATDVPVVVANGSDMTTTSTSQVTVPPVTCSAEGIRLAVVATDAAMGLRDLAFELVNCGTAPYTVSGYPDVRLLDEDHQPIEVTVEQGDGSVAMVPEFDNPPGTVTLQPGERARSGLLWRNLVTDADLTKVATAYSFEVRTGAGKPWQEVPLVMPDDTNGARQTLVDLGNTRKIGVRAWLKA
jgi:hypothetical protein